MGEIIDLPLDQMPIESLPVMGTIDQASILCNYTPKTLLKKKCQRTIPKNWYFQTNPGDQIQWRLQEIAKKVRGIR